MRTRSSDPSLVGYPRVSSRRSRLGLNVFLVQCREYPRRESSGGMSDKTLTCRDCGEEFVFTAGEQAFYQERGFSEPQRCNNCRQKRKQERQSSGYDGGGYGGGGGGGYRVAAAEADTPAARCTQRSAPTVARRRKFRSYRGRTSRLQPAASASRSDAPAHLGTVLTKLGEKPGGADAEPVHN